MCTTVASRNSSLSYILTTKLTSTADAISGTPDFTASPAGCYYFSPVTNIICYNMFDMKIKILLSDLLMKILASGAIPL